MTDSNFKSYLVETVQLYQLQTETILAHVKYLRRKGQIVDRYD